MQILVEAVQEFWVALQSGQLPPLGTWSYFLLAVLVMVEGPIATLLGAAAASGGMMKPVWVFFAASGGNLAADVLWYLLGRMGKKEWLLQHARWTGLNRAHLQRLEEEMRLHAGKILLTAKLSAGLVIPALVAAGMVRVPVRRWFVALFAAECLWTGVLVVIGVYLTESIAMVERGLHYLAIGATLVVALIGGVAFLRRTLETTGHPLPAADESLGEEGPMEDSDNIEQGCTECESS